jgi:hypothetical protein
MKTFTLIQSLVAATVLCFSAAWAQQPPKDSQSSSPATPIQPLSPLTGSNNGGQQTIVDVSLTQGGAQSQTSAQAQPDTHVLSSAETLGVGSLRGLRRIFDPALQISEFDETGLAPGRATVVSNLGGSLDMDQHWGRYHLAAAYHGAEVIYQPPYSGMHYLSYHNLSISSEVLLGRWTLRLRDSALYSWGTGFGGLFTGGPAQGSQDSSLNSIRPSLVPNGTIQTGLARQLNNTALGEVDYAFSHRTTLTVVGSYGFLFFGPGYIDNKSITGRVGYNYALSAANSISLSYDYNRISFGGASNRLQTDLVQMSFGRKITGRLAFQLGAGPQLLRLENFGASGSRQLSWSAFGALTYNLPRTGYSLSYFRGVTAGSGVFFGSKSQTITGAVNREFTRFWSASVNGGYAINNSLLTNGFLASRFYNWFAGASLNRQIGRQIRFSLSYGFQRQTSGGGGVCPVLSCGLPGSLSFRQFGATLQWRPLAPRSR